MHRWSSPRDERVKKQVVDRWLNMLFTRFPMNPVEKAIEILGTQANLARACEQRPQAVTRWLREGRVPAKHASAIESATAGAVTRHDLRPDIFGPPPSSEVQREVA